jgi:agmatine deiminase
MHQQQQQLAAGSYEQDKLVAAKLCEAEGLPYVSTDFVLEGGSIHVDGEG